MIDLHCHSTASDGTLSPSALVLTAAENGVSMLALTDHDTMAGLEAASKTAHELAMIFIPGIEIEIDYPVGVFHLLGLGVRNDSASMNDLIAEARLLRETRNAKIIARMNQIGIRCDYTDIGAYAGGGIVGRPHFARFLVENEWAQNVQDAFDRFLGRGRELYEQREGVELERALHAIHSAGGWAFIAHPFSLRLNWNTLRKRLQEWKDLGLDGLETYHPGIPYRETRRYARIATELGLRQSGGSDFHSPDEGERRLGRSCVEKRKIPDELGIQFEQFDFQREYRAN